MKRFYYIFLIFIALSLISFAVFRRLGLVVSIENIDKNEKSLMLKFNTFDFKTGNPINYNGSIEIFKNDSLYIRLIPDTIINNNKTTELTFNSIPEGFKLVYPENAKQLPILNKDDNLKFLFSNGSYFGYWIYKPFYLTKKARWSFDINGKQIIEINCEYERWLMGNDIIKIKMNKEYKITKTNITLLDENNDSLSFELKQKHNPTSKFALRIKNKSKAGNKIRILIDFEDKNHYEEIIKVPDRSTIGIMGKYYDL